MKTSEVLREALDYLWDGKDIKDPRQVLGEHICHAIVCAKFKKTSVSNHEWRQFDHDQDGYQRTQEMVQDRLYPSISAGGWLVKNGIPINQLTEVKMQEWRRLWILSMIAEFETNGD